MAEKTTGTDIKRPNTSKWRLLKYGIYTAYISSLFLLLAVVLAIIANRKPAPFYSWIESTKAESIGNFVAGLIIEQKVSMQINAENDPLSEEEFQKFKTLTLEEKFSKNPYFKKAKLEPRDQRFILNHPKMRPIQAGKYLILTNSHSEEVLKFAGILDDLYSKFIIEMYGSDFISKNRMRPHICYLKNRAEYLSLSRKDTKNFHDSLGFFSPVKNCIYLFSRKDSLEGLEIEEKFADARTRGKKIYKGRKLKKYLKRVDEDELKYINKLEDETICTLRHEGTHQLSHMLGLHSLRGFEKRWLTEGLAQYFETGKPGMVKIAKKNLLIKSLNEQSLISWEQLINTDEGSFKSSGHRKRQLAYSQSWVLVRFLMRKYKEDFFTYIKQTRETGVLDKPLKSMGLLCKTLGTSPQKLTAELNHEILTLP